MAKFEPFESPKRKAPVTRGLHNIYKVTNYCDARYARYAAQLKSLFKHLSKSRTALKAVSQALLKKLSSDFL